MIERTQHVEPCEERPPYEDWDDRALIYGFCPLCGVYVRNDYFKQSRVLRARQIIRERSAA